MSKVYLLVSSIIDEDLNARVIIDIHGVFFSIEDARHSLSVLKPKSVLDLEIIEKEVI